MGDKRRMTDFELYECSENKRKESKKRIAELEQQIEKMKNDLREVKNNYDKSKDKTPISMFGAEYRLFCDIENLLDKWE